MVKPATHGGLRRRHHSGAAGTAQGLAQTRSTRGSVPAFNKVLPRKMDALVAEGLFVVDPNAPGGYRITEKGLERLKDLDDGQPKT